MWWTFNTIKSAFCPLLLVRKLYKKIVHPLNRLRWILYNFFRVCQTTYYSSRLMQFIWFYIWWTLHTRKSVCYPLLLLRKLYWKFIYTLNILSLILYNILPMALDSQVLHDFIYGECLILENQYFLPHYLLENHTENFYSN